MKTDEAENYLERGIRVATSLDLLGRLVAHCDYDRLEAEHPEAFRSVGIMARVLSEQLWDSLEGMSGAIRGGK